MLQYCSYGCRWAGIRNFLIIIVFCVISYCLAGSSLIYSNPRVYNVDYSFELVPDPNKINRSKDLKLWLPIPREWDSQKAVKLLSVQPKPHAEYTDPEYGNPMFFWDFGKGPQKPSYKVDIKFRMESYEVHAEIDPDKVGSYDKTSKEYDLYTRSTHTVSITPKIKELARQAVGDENNPYLQAEDIFKFVREKVRYKMHRLERGVGTEVLLSFPSQDEKTGEEYYEGACGQQHAMFVALCRAVGIPARAVVGFVGWNPWINEEDLNLFLPIEHKVSPEGLAGTQHYIAAMPHVWSEFYLPGYGWIPVDVTGRQFGHSKVRLIMSKGFDVQIGPHSPGKESEGYGFQWVLLHNGTTDVLQTGVWNIARIRIAKAKILHNSEPFPADGYAEYAEHVYPESEAEEKLRNWRQEVLLSFYNAQKRGLNKGNIFETHPRFNSKREAYLCHLLHQIVGDKKFLKIFQAYLDLRQKSNQTVSTARFQKLAENVYGKPLDWFFKQWVDSTALPQFKLDNVMVEKGANKWRVYGSLLQVGKTYYRVPVKLVLETEQGQETREIWLGSNKTDFEFYTTNQPKKLIVDPEYHIPTIRWMPPRLQMLWDFYPELIVIYGSLAEAEANKTAAERFVDEFAGLSHEIIKADADVNEADLKTRCVILFGRPETNKITQRFQDSFHIKFEKDKFTWKGITYDKPTQGVAQIVENPLEPQGLMIMYAGLSGEATQKFCESFFFNKDASYVIFDVDKELLRGDWEDSDSDLVWRFEKPAAGPKN